MQTINSLIKIQKGKKTFMIKKPTSIKELESKFTSKFKLNNLDNFSFYYQDQNKDEITIEGNEDLLTAFDYMEANLKIRIKEKIGDSNSVNFLKKEHLGIYEEFLKSNLPEFEDNLEKIIDKGELPCKDCYFSDDNSNENSNNDDSFISKEPCYKCKGKGLRKIDNNWLLILFLINFKIKQFILNPIQTFNEDNNNIDCLEKKNMISSCKTTAPNSDNINNKYEYVTNLNNFHPNNKIEKKPPIINVV